MRSRCVPGLTAAERQTLLRWAPDPFGGDAAGLQHLVYRSKPLTWVLYDDADQPIARACALPTTCGINDNPAVPIGGIGGIITVPAHQRQGHATRLIAEVLDHLYARYARAVLLFCLDPLLPFYAKRGFTRVTCPVVIEQPGGPIPLPPPLNLCIHTRTPDPAVVPVRAIDLRSRPW
jgi:GNAT superfamily N-acetyltransferase